ncbi:hypothetical protein OROHE_005459 [Orobanche hederae]
MAAIAILDLLRKNPNFGAQTFNSRGLFSGKLVGASTAATSFAVTTPFAFGALFGNGVPQVAYCDAGVSASLGEDFLFGVRSASQSILQNDALKYTTKQYDIQLKPLFSAFHWKNFALTSLRSFLLFYLPLLEPSTGMEDDDDDFLHEYSEGKHLDLVVPFKNSVKQIIHEITVTTIRRVLERLAVQHVSQQTAWKLLKGQYLGALASWIVHVGVDVYRFFSSITKTPEDNDAVDTAEQLEILGRKVCGATVRCCASITFASIGAGIGATLIRPSTGQWIGCTIGDLAGPLIVAFSFEKLHMDFFL